MVKNSKLHQTMEYVVIYAIFLIDNFRVAFYLCFKVSPSPRGVLRYISDGEVRMRPNLYT